MVTVSVWTTGLDPLVPLTLVDATIAVISVPDQPTSIVSQLNLTQP